ncbi:hypothetical protein Z946_3511 [Sulfitobacter noctilucicola]|uniref:Uncharacterized protein n=2 Tax=Sulfitobacter noctilucicola TaxID=1342301 RepID=A0A7W6Q3H8_9RHOB|nr:hypothetical protein [Sulfitobacter noctilucicola]KIN64619.1 hypothetical protein Z946_3511 [Sulfitobacter noctilucicola]MBB4174230.1 hypothetical protein [Sulfitobacter noctilucicola]
MRALSAFIQKHVRPKGSPLPFSPQAEDTAPASTPLPALIRRRAPRTVMNSVAQNLLHIACPDPTAEDAIRDKYLLSAQHLVRQERWEDLISAIGIADLKRHLTPGGMPVAELMAFGARSDVVHAVEHALMDGRPPKDAPLLAGIEALEHVLVEHSESYVVACIVAQAHMDTAWAWRGTGWDIEVPTRNREAFCAHFDRASDIMEPFCAITVDSPLLAATGCALLGGSSEDKRPVADCYEALIDLNPLNPRPMRAMGNHLLPRWYGSYAELELEARRTAARTADTWGAGGYTWVQFDAISCDDTACANLDLDFFVEGLHDILSRRPNAYNANLLAAYCANSVGQSFSGNDQADQVRSQIADCAQWIVREHLTELHPMIWAHAARGFDNNLRVYSPARFAASGRDDAMRIISSLFSAEIASGKRIVFTDNGPIAQAS